MPTDNMILSFDRNRVARFDFRFLAADVRFHGMCEICIGEVGLLVDLVEALEGVVAMALLFLLLQFLGL